MYRFILIFYIICFGVFILFSRQPDFFDGEFTTGHIHFATDSISGKPVPLAVYFLGKDSFRVRAAYLFRQYTEGEQVPMIYEAARPKEAAVYSWWGYWITWSECLGSVALLVVGILAAKAITHNPAPGHDENEDLPRRRKRRYTS